MTVAIAVLPDSVRPSLQNRLPDWLDVRWWRSPEELVALASAAEIGWFDMHEKQAPLAAIEAAAGLRWLNT